MQLLLTLSAGAPFTLPINYQQLIHGMIYRALSRDGAYSGPLHDAHQNSGDSRAFKGFSFSSLQGAYTVAGRSIRFDGSASLEVRSVDPRLVQLLAQYVRAEGAIVLGAERLSVLRCETADRHVLESALAVRMLTPAVAYRTDESRHTVFFQPDEDAFYESLVRNAARKSSFFQPQVPFQLRIRSLNDGLPKKRLSHFKKTYITGWLGNYLLEGTPEVIDLLYQTGLGAKNSEGFGMFVPASAQGPVLGDGARRG